MSPLSFSNLSVGIEENVKLKNYTTFQLGGPCKGLFNCQTPQELQDVVNELAGQGLPFILIGGGSNLVVSDSGLDCYVIRYVSEEPIVERDGNDLIVSASTILDDLVLYAAKNALEGLNYASGIPGTVGGAIVGNAGAFGKQVGDVTTSVTLISQSGEVRDAKTQELGFSYRYSNLRESGDIVSSVRFQLSEGNKDALLKEREEILSVRREKHPDLSVDPCAGSFFRNVEPTSKAGKRQATGWFLDQAGGRELSVGGAKIFDKHANIIVKSDGCTSEDVYQLSCEMAKLAKEKFDLDLVREVKFVGEFKDKPKDSDSVIW